jgi:hypothetical protein
MGLPRQDAAAARDCATAAGKVKSNVTAFRAETSWDPAFRHINDPL